MTAVERESSWRDMAGRGRMLQEGEEEEEMGSRRQTDREMQDI